ncbi:MAG: hypothetical protein NC205_04615 [Prevotella sp.]|nr:hypothetical protein [Alistipes senegalensis]MCM1357856.1 hypothetical protein [Prevotella sp.]
MFNDFFCLFHHLTFGNPQRRFCDSNCFSEFLVYDMEKPNCEPEQVFLKDLPKEYYRLQFLVDTGNDNIKK